jgi:RHS repeat-associated protein
MAAADVHPPAPFGEANVRVADVDFDKRSDIILSVGHGDGYQYWLNLGQGGYSPRQAGSSGDPVAYTFDVQGTEVTDFNGDRVPDIVRIRPTGVEFAAGIGYGRFLPSEFIALADAPFDEAVMQRARLSDLTGDGLPDLVIERAAPGELWYWINLGNRSFSRLHVIDGLPNDLAPTAVVRWADVNGNGTSDLVYADSTHPSRLLAVDVGLLIGCTPASHLLRDIENGIGRKTRLEYRPSTFFSLQDAADGWPWPDSVPFPVQVVSAVITEDSLGHSYRSEFRYHDGYYDPEEKQFRGFARVEQVDVGDASAPTLVTRSHFDTGRDFEAMKGRLLRLTAGQEDGRVFYDETTGWTVPPVTLHAGVNGEAVSYAHPTNSVRIVSELGQGTARRLESDFAYDEFGNQTLDADYGVVEGGDRSAFDDERIVSTEYAINTNAWILRTPARHETRDEHGVALSRTEFFYDDETFAGNNLGLVTIGNLTLKREWTNAASPAGFIAAVRTKYDPYGNPVAILDPLAVAPGGAVDTGRGHVRDIAYDPRFRTYPVTETIHVGEGREPLVFQAAYDEGFGTVTASTDFNGNTTRYGYDEFGRLINLVRPGDSDDFPTAEYGYALAVPYQGTNLVNYVETRMLDKTPGAAAGRRDHYLISRDFVDGLGRKLLSKQEATESADQPRVTVKGAVLFNARQKPSIALNPFYTTLAGDLDAQLAYESLEAPGWAGRFALDGSLADLDLNAAHKTLTTYDATLREVKATNPDGTFRRTAYEPLVTRSYDENDTDPASPSFDTPMVHHNDGLGRLVRVDEITRLSDDGTPAGAHKTWATRYEYDLNDQLTRITDSQNNVKTFTYDGFRRKTGMNDPDRGVMIFGYDDASNLIETTDAKGQRITYTYDGANRIRTEDYHDAGQPFSANFAFNPALPISSTNRPDVAYFYDVPQAGLDVGDGSVATAANTRGKLAYVWDLSGEEHTSYDARDRVGYVVKRVRDPLHGRLVSFRTAFAYDSLDRLTDLTYPDNDAIGYRYNDRSLLARITGGPAGSVLSRLDYLPSDQQREVLYGNGVRTAYAYDERLRLKTLGTAPEAAPAAPFIAFAYEFDGVSNIRRIDDQRPGSVVPAGDPRRNTQIFQYDDLHRLTQVQYSFALPGQADRNDGEISYRYDRIGNMLAQTSTFTNHLEKGLPVADLGEMESGGASGRMGRIGRNPGDPPGPHALTSIQNPASSIQHRVYPYDANGNMTALDGMVATWDFKDRLVALEDATMRADYAYDFTDRRITKRVTRKPSPLPSDGRGAGGEGIRHSFTTIYVGKHFEVREFDAPTKFVFHGDTRVARVTGTLSPSHRVQRLRVHPGWNLLSLAVTAERAGAQLAALGEVEAVYRWDSAARAFGEVAVQDTLPAGSVLWVRASAAATLRVTGVYPGPWPNLRGPPEGDFLPSYGLEALPFTNHPAALAAWRFASETQDWQAKLPPPLEAFSDLPPSLAPHEAFYAAAAEAVDLETPDQALSLRIYHQDHLGSSSVMSDAAGRLVEEAANYPFGAPRTAYRPRGVREDYQFTQKERDAESAFHYFEARYLSAGIGRFISVDPVALALPAAHLRNPQRFHAYAYAGNHPVIAHDPSGRAWGLLAKVVKLAIKGGDIASTVAGAVEDIGTITSADASLGERLFAGVSLASEILSPVSIKDAKHIAKAVDTAKDAKDNLKALGKADDVIGDIGAKTTSRQARREAMRREGIPTSQQPTSQSRNDSGREQSYEVPKPGGGTQTKSVQQQTMDSSHPDQGHWEAGKVKTDPLTGEARMNQHGRPKLTNDKSKVDYNE